MIFCFCHGKFSSKHVIATLEQIIKVVKYCNDYELFYSNFNIHFFFLYMTHNIYYVFVNFCLYI